tara:strand:- start:25 stop:465 length:441 start_codon:yes stop_codon:yes gene_type:complete
MYLSIYVNPALTTHLAQGMRIIMPNKKYLIGYRFEKKTATVIRDMFNKYDYLLYYIIESRGSKGKADLIVGVTNLNTGKRTWFGVQCKRGYISKPQMHRNARLAMKENGMLLYHATLDKDKKLAFYPNLELEISGMGIMVETVIDD